MKDKNYNSEQRFANILSKYVDQLNEGSAPSIEVFLKGYEALARDQKELLEFAAFISEVSHVEEVSECKKTEAFEKIQARLVHSEKKQILESLESEKEALVIDKRPDFLILLLHFMKEIWGKSRVVKLLFLMSKEYRFDKYVNDFYSHYAYNYGPFDRVIYEDIEVLKQYGIVDERKPRQKKKCSEEEIDERDSEEKVDSVYSLTEKGEKFADVLIKSIKGKDSTLIKEINDLKSKYGYMPLKKLLKYIYSQYPEYAKNSKIKDEILGDE